MGVARSGRDGEVCRCAPVQGGIVEEDVRESKNVSTSDLLFLRTDTFD